MRAAQLRKAVPGVATVSAAGGEYAAGGGHGSPGEQKSKPGNAALMTELLDGEFEGQPVYLYLERERLAALESAVGTSLPDAVAETISLARGRRLLSPTGPGGGGLGAGGQDRAAAVPRTPRGAHRSRPAAMVADQAFSANNYRDRLCALLRAEGHARAEKLKRDFPDTVALWQALNDWLEGGGRGRWAPAHRAGPWALRQHRGYPVSQALVRAHDRQANAHEAFEAYGLSPRRRVSIAWRCSSI